MKVISKLPKLLTVLRANVLCSHCETTGECECDSDSVTAYCVKLDEHEPDYLFTRKELGILKRAGVKIDWTPENQRIKNLHWFKVSVREGRVET